MSRGRPERHRLHAMACGVGKGVCCWCIEVTRHTSTYAKSTRPGGGTDGNLFIAGRRRLEDFMCSLTVDGEVSDGIWYGIAAVQPIDELLAWLI